MQREKKTLELLVRKIVSGSKHYIWDFWPSVNYFLWYAFLVALFPMIRAYMRKLFKVGK